MEEESMHLSYFNSSSKIENNSRLIAKNKLGGQRMKRSFVSSAIASVGTMLASFGLAAMMFLSISTRAQALTISVGTPTVVDISNDRIIDAVQAQIQDGTADNRINIFYATKSADGQTFSIMLASNNYAGGYNFTTLSTGTIANNSPKYLSVVYYSSSPHLYYYDASSKTINYLVGTTAFQNPQFILGAGKVEATGLDANASGTGFLLVYSSKSADGARYSLEASSVTFGSSADTLGSFITVLSTSQGNIGSSGYLGSFLNSTSRDRGVVYFDDNADALKLVNISAGSIVEQSRETIDNGSSISDVSVQDASNVTRILYTNSSAAKYAVQRRNISTCWFIQKIDDGAAGKLDGTGLIVSYIKSSNLWAAFGIAGSFFDDFSEDIVNAQLGKATLVSGLTASKGGILSNPGDGRRPLGSFVHANGIASLNFLTLSGTVQDSYGQAIASVLVKPDITSGGTGAKDLASTSISGSLSDANNSGNYTVRVASGATMTVSASSAASGSPSYWAFVHTATHTSISVSTASTNSFAQSISLNFLGISSPTFADRPSSAAAVANDIVTGAPFAGITITTISVAWGIGEISNTAATSSFTFTSNNALITERFAKAGNFRFAPAAKDTLAEDSDFISTGTVTEYSGNTAVANRHIEVTSFQTSIDNGVNIQGGVSQFRNITASTASTLPLTYTVVYTTKTPAGHLMMGSKTNAVTLTKFQFNILNQPNDGVSLSSIPINTSTGSQFVLISYSSNGPMFPRNLSASGDLTVGQVFLSTDTDLTKAPDNIGNKISLTVTASSNSTIVRTIGNVFGINSSSTVYVRISTQINGQWHSAISTGITFSTPTITSVAGITGDSLSVISSSTSVSVNINGTGLIGGTTIWVTTATVGTGFCSGVPCTPGTALAHLTENARVTAYQVQSSTWATATFVPKANPSGVYYIYLGTSSVNSGVAGAPAESTLVGSTIVVNTPGISIKIASMSISSILLQSNQADVRTSSNIVNNRSYTLTVKGWGLLVGSTISFKAVDGSSETAAVILTGVDSEQRVGTLSNVNFVGVQAGKFYNVFIGTINVPAGSELGNTTVTASGLATRSGTSIIYTETALFVASAAISTITTPVITDIPNGTIFNSTSNVTLNFSGRGFVVGSSITFDNGGSVNFSTVVFTAGDIGTDGLNMRVTIVGTAAVNGLPSTGLFAATSTGVYTVRITTTLANAGTSLSTGSITLLGSTVTSVAADSTNTNYASLKAASFTITGQGLMDGATAELYLASDAGLARIGSTGLTVYAPARSSATAVFDLRGATQPGAVTYTMLVDQVSNSAIHKTERVRALSAANLTISSIPALNSITPTTANNSNAKTVTIYGRGLPTGATVEGRLNGANSADFDGGASASSATFSANLTVSDSSGTTGTFSFPSGKLPGEWILSISTTIQTGVYGSATLSVAGRTLVSTGSLGAFTVTESSAPNAPTGLTVLSAGTKEVTLQWIAPGDNGTTGNLTAGAGFLIYYSSSASNRAQGCAPCYPIGSLQGLTGSPLTGYTTNYNFANTWAQFLPYGHRDSAISTNTGITNAPAFNYSSSTTKGLAASTFTKTIGTDSLIVNGTAGTSAIVPGSTVQVTLTIDPLTEDADFWFAVRAFDEGANTSTTTIVYSTVSARIKASVDVVLKSGDPTIDPNKDNTVTYTVTEVSVAGVVVKEITIDTPKGALDGADKFLTPTVISNPPADTPGVEGVGVALDINLESGKKEFKKSIDITLKVDESQLLTKLAGKSIEKVKLAFHNDDSKWVKNKESSLNAGGNVKGKTTHLTKFRVVIAAPAANLSGTVVYPNPFRPTVAAQLAQGITFDLMPVDSTIQIYTLAGDLVKQLKADANGIVNWNAKNEDGKDVASGVYFALIKGGGDKKTLKIAVQR